MSVYSHEDTRVTASKWIYNNIPDKSYVLSETANVVDIPLPMANFSRNYTYVSFNFYELDSSPSLQQELKVHLQRANYIFIPSRRIFKNLLEENYALLNDYYEKIFNNQEFEKIAEFTSYPKISVFGKTLLEFPDEKAEETFTVFDHPVIRIYKKI